MKKPNLFLFILVLALGVPLPAAADPALQAKADALMQKWRTAISREDVNGYVGCYWSDATNNCFDSSGEPSLLGVNALRDRQQRWADALDSSTLDMNYPKPSRFFQASGNMCVYAYVLDQFSEMAVFYFQLRGGELRILRQIDMSY
jgi:hypothetical protein